jgi:hypothetical protein
MVTDDPTHIVISGPASGVGLDITLTVCVLVPGQGPFVVYSTVYVAPATPPEISPVELFIDTPPPGFGLKEKVPPDVAIPVALFEAPSQKSVNVNVASSAVITSTLT